MPIIRTQIGTRAYRAKFNDPLKFNNHGATMTKEVARVYVNEIEVGALPANLYKKIVEDVRRDKRLLFAQAMNYCHVLYLFFRKTVVLWPIALCVAVALCEMFGPSNVVDIIAAMRTATPAEANHAICTFLAIGWATSVIFEAFCRVLSNRHSGLVDCFDEAISRRVRSLLEEPAEGRLLVIVGSDANDEQ